MDMDRSCPFVFYISFYMIQRPDYQGLGIPCDWDAMEGGGWLCICELLEKVLAFALCIQGRLGGAFYTYITGGNSIMDRSYFSLFPFSVCLSFTFLYLCCSIAHFRHVQLSPLHGDGECECGLLVHAC